MLRRRLIPIEVTCDNWQRVHQGSNWPVPVNDQSSRIVFSCHTFSCIVRGRLRLLLKLWIELWCFRFWNTYLKTCQHVVSGWVSRQPRRSSGTSFSEIKVLVWLRSTVPGQLEDGRAARFGPPWILTPLFLLLFKRFSAQLWSCSSTWTKTKPYQVIQNTNETRKKKPKKNKLSLSVTWLLILCRRNIINEITMRKLKILNFSFKKLAISSLHLDIWLSLFEKCLLRGVKGQMLLFHQNRKPGSFWNPVLCATVWQ